MLRRIALFGVPVLILGAGVLIAADWWVTVPEGQKAEYVGRQSCTGCHTEFYHLWEGTSHDLAMDHATPQTVLGKFGSEKNPAKLQHFDTPFRMFRKGDSFCVETIGPGGKLDTFKIKYVFGAVILQQYLVELPGGKVQALPIAWDVKGKRWYHLYPDEPLPPSDTLHWTKRLQNWNYMCAECHVTNYHKGYNAENDTYHTTFGEIDVSCEACHGPCSIHVDLAENNIFWDRKLGKGMPNPRDPKIELDSCAPCHARRQHVYPGFKPGEEFLDFYIPDMLDSENYHPDGQFLGEDYEYGSYVQSRMYHNKVLCRTCHTAKHKYKDHRLCATCHDPKKYDTPEHHFHPNNSPGAECVNCHMPQKVYMGVDLRHDHSFRIPRPDLTISLKIPNTCNSCHEDESPEWAEKYLTKWYGKRKETVPHFAHAISAGRKHLPGAEQKLIEVVKHNGDFLKREGWPAYIRAGALMLLVNYPTSPEVIEVVCENLEDKDPLVRYAAVHALEHASPAVLNDKVAPMLTDPVRAVRVEAARILASIKERTLAKKYDKAFNAALKEYRKGQNYLADQPAAHLNLAVLHENLGEPKKALAAYEHAIKLDPAFVPARMNLSLLLDRFGEKKQAEEELRQAIKAAPEYGEAYYSLGLLLAEKKETLPEAAEMLARAAELTPTNARMRYNLGLAYQQLGKVKEAEAALKESCRLAPAPSNLYALAILYVQNDRKAEALPILRQILEITPNDRRIQQLIYYLQSQPEKPEQEPEKEPEPNKEPEQDQKAPDQANHPFAGNYQGKGVDSEGVKATFAAKVSHLDGNKYRVLILDKLDTKKKPMHVMDG
ncbi:MAG: tetratricopeptide repeat protein, partial [Planctomycetia bacterium]